MPVRRSSIILAGIGVVLIVLGVLVRFVVVPVATKLPGSLYRCSGGGLIASRIDQQDLDRTKTCARSLPFER